MEGIQELVERVSDYVVSHPDERDPWQKAPAMTGILMWDNDRHVRVMRRWLQRAVDTQSTAGVLAYHERIDLPTGHVRTFTPTPALSSSIGYPLMLFHEREQDANLLEAAKRQAEALLAAPRTSEGGILTRLEAPELWIDFIYMMCPFLVKLGQATRESRYIDEAFRQAEVHIGRLVDPTEHLARHAWCEVPNHFPQSTFWSRGNGWLVCTIVDMLEAAPDHPGANRLKTVCTRALERMRSFQDRSGYLRHILDDPYSKFEASGSLMYAYAVAKAVQGGYCDPSFIPSALRAVTVVSGSIGEDGAVNGVAVQPGGPGVPFGSTLFGQGFYLQAVAALKREFQL